MNRYENEEKYFRDNLSQAREESGDYFKGTRSGAIEDNPELGFEKNADRDYTVSFSSDNVQEGFNGYGGVTSGAVEDNPESWKVREGVKKAADSPELIPTGGPTLDDQIRIGEAMAAGAREIDAPNPLVSNYDDKLEVSTAAAALQRERAKPLRTVLKGLINGEFPRNETELRAQLNRMDVRKDLVKELLEAKSNKLLDALEAARSDFSVETTQSINKQVYEFLALVTTLSDMGHKMAHKFGEYDPYYAELGLSDISSELFRRRRNGCDIEIPIPKNYNSDGDYPKLDAIQTIQLVQQEIDGNEASWKYFADKALEKQQLEEQKRVDSFNNARAIQQGIDKDKRDELLNGYNMSQGGAKK